MKRLFFLPVSLGIMLTLAGCGSSEDTEDNKVVEDSEETSSQPTTEKESAVEKITVDLNNAEGDEVGKVNLEETDGGVRILLDAANLPKGTHAIHIHETGACEKPDFESAGGHFNPTNASHGTEHEKGAHAGDLPNIEVADDGTIKEELLAKGVTLKMDQENTLFDSDGSALVIHEKADDYKSQPSGDAGDRIACGEIGK
ncbi:superoxide dismutase family protein [Peribacillus sp. FSL H8-0477]|uniref:superoxide dismutase family protein n=1 Tax=Peribacillus sp. FSL H8-0477 TaxID=2921388 RepID=UPI0030FAD13A